MKLYKISVVDPIVVQPGQGIISRGSKRGTLLGSSTTSPYPTTTTEGSVPTSINYVLKVEPNVWDILKSDQVIESQGTTPGTLQNLYTTTPKPSTSTIKGSVPTSGPFKEVEPTDLRISKPAQEIKSQGPKPGTFMGSSTTTVKPIPTTMGFVPTSVPVKEIKPTDLRIIKPAQEIKSQGPKPGTLMGSSTTTVKPIPTTMGFVPTSVPVKEIKPTDLRIIKPAQEIKSQGPKPGTLMGSSTTTVKPIPTTMGFVPTSEPVKAVKPLVLRISKLAQEIKSQGLKPGTLMGSSTTTVKPIPTTMGFVPTSVPVKVVKPIVVMMEQPADVLKLQRIKPDTSPESFTTDQKSTTTTKSSALPSVPLKVVVPSIELNRIQDKAPKSLQPKPSRTTTLGSTTTTPTPTTKESVPASPRLKVVAPSIELNIKLNMKPKPMRPKPSTGTLHGSTTTVPGYTSTTVPGYTPTTGVSVPLESSGATCPDPAVEPGVQYTVQDTGDTLSYQCQSGYRHVFGDMTRTCRKNGTWNGTAPVCHKVTCNRPARGGVSPSPYKQSYNVGEVVTFTCISQMSRTRSRGKIIRVTCTLSGGWSGPSFLVCI
ncbi:mucin-5AC-like [Mytilus californianus]|uniref:mucin-5AC-like n=1 Tax=Mytilus californianus TaxID=6549 RepID=UPI0022454B13|nr:mucin-5AC-like [Mytilus californianus]